VALRLHRWSLGAIAALSLLFTVLCGWLAWDVASTAATCATATASARCAELEASGTVRSQDVVKVLGALGFLPFISGSVLGVPLVAREIEQRTASLAWPLAGSRVRWLARIGLPVAVLGALLVAIPAAAGFVLVASYAPGVDPARTFEHFGMFGPAIVVRYVAVTSIALFVGTWLGRTLPGLIVAAAAAVVVYFALSSTYGLWLPAVPLPPVEKPGEDIGRLYVSQMVRMPDGRLIPIDDALAIDPGLDDITESVEFGLPPERAPEVALREDATLVGGSILIVVATIVRLRRRPPY